MQDDLATKRKLDRGMTPNIYLQSEMKTIRAFIALDINEEVRIGITSLIKRCEKLNLKGVNWTPVRNIHLTLKFLGDIPQDKVSLIANSLKSVCEGITPFEMDIKTLGVFPGMQNPRIIWAGIENPTPVAGLQRGIEDALLIIGFPPENRPFSPHLTFGRVSERIEKAEIMKLAGFVSGEASIVLGSTRVESAVLYKSNLMPSGAVYTEIARTHFSGKK